MMRMEIKPTYIARIENPLSTQTGNFIHFQSGIIFKLGRSFPELSMKFMPK